MEESQNQVYNETPSYWTSIFIAAFVLGFIYFVVSLIGGYATINSEPTGSMFGSMGQTVAGIVGCLVAGFGGLLAVWHYCKSYENVVVTLGKGALIGVYTGFVIVVIMTILSQVWDLIDPSYTDKLMNSMIENYEAMENLPEAQKQQIIDGVASQFKDSNTLWGILKGMLFLAIPSCILNLITGMIGAKLFSKKEEIV